MFRKILLSIAILFLSAPAFADVTSEIIAHEIDANGNIVVKVQYLIDGQEVVSKYPKCCADANYPDGKYYWVFRAFALNFPAGSAVEITAFVDDQIKNFAEKIITDEFLKQENEKIATAEFEKLIGRKATFTSALIAVDTDKDGVADKEWTVKNDGSKVEADIIAVP